MDQHEIPDLSNLQKRRKVKLYEYLEIECIFSISAKKDKFVEWLDNNRNDSFLDRFFGNLGNMSNYGKIQKLIFVHQNESKKKINGSITAVLNKYGRLGWELVAVRHEYLREPPNYNLSDSDITKYYRQTIYSLKKSLYVDANTISHFGEQLTQLGDRLPELLRQCVQQAVLPAHVYRYILDFLTSQPTPEQIAAFRPTPEMQERLSALLAKNQSGNITPTEIEELNEYERIEHLVIMLKLGGNRIIH